MTSAPLVNPALHEGFWIEARYALSAADGRIHKSLLINREARSHIGSQMAQLNDAHFDLEILSGLFADIFPDYFDRSSFVAWLEQGLRAFDSLAGRFTAAALREAEPGSVFKTKGVPEVQLHLVFSKARLAAIETFSLTLAEYQTLGQIRAWSYPGLYLGSTMPGEEGGPLAVWLDVAVERFGVGLVRRLSERAIVLNGKRP